LPRGFFHFNYFSTSLIYKYFENSIILDSFSFAHEQ